MSEKEEIVEEIVEKVEEEPIKKKRGRKIGSKYTKKDKYKITIYNPITKEEIGEELYGTMPEFAKKMGISLSICWKYMKAGRKDKGFKIEKI